MELRKISIKTIIGEAIRDLGLGDMEIPYLDFIEWCAWGLQQIGAYSQYKEVYNCNIQLENYRATLPLDFYKPMENPGLIYKITGDMITSNVKSECISFNYLAFETDEDGFPMIPDHASYKEALVWLIAYRLCMRDQLPNKKLTLMDCKRLWNFYCGQARAKANELDEDGKARFAAMFLGLRTPFNQHKHNFNLVDNNKRIADKK